MAFAINIRSDNESADHIRRLWVAASALESSSSMQAMDYPPHITVAVYDEVQEQLLFNALDAAFCGRGSFTVRFDGLGSFETAHSIVLWAAPTIPDSLRAAVERVHEQLDAALCRPNYRPGAWIPHCTLALSVSLENRDRAMAFANQNVAPFEVIFDVADCASFHPVTVLRECALTAEIS